MITLKRYLLTLVALLAMTAGAWADDWTNIVKNSDMEGTDVSCFYVKENAKGAGNMYLAHITEGIGVDGSRAIKVTSDGNEVETWDTQFFIRLPYELPAGTKYKLSFDFKANKEAAADFQCANEPGEYIIWYIGQDDTEDFSFSTSWQTFSKEFTVPAAANGSNNEGGWKNNFQTIYFSLALKAKEGGEANEYFIDNVKVEIQNDVLATLTKSPVTDPSLMIPYVTLSDDLTEADFMMSTTDLTVDYELVRDMSVQMTATMGDGTDGVRYRVKKAQQGEGYEPADLNMMQVLALVAVNDGIEQKALTLNQDFFCRIYKLDEQTLQPVGDGMLLSEFNFAPGLYALKAFAQGGSDYDGETALSNTFKLFQGYEVEIAAGEYATFYKEENLYVEDEDAELYTITSVGSETATAAPLTVAKAYTPILVKNKGAEKKMILLIPTETEGDDVTAAPEFIGTLEATTIAASSENQNNYAFNGLQFVWVKNAIAVGANKAWLAINTGVPSARGITLVFDETTKIANTNITNLTNGNWYDLNGRKLDKMPTKKGVYIMNGKKVVVK